MKKIELKYITKKETLKKQNTESNIKQDWWPLMGVSFTVSPGEALGLVGDNGSGKHLLLQIIAGRQNQTTGFVTHDDPVAYASLTNFPYGEKSGLENVKSKVSRADIDSFRKDHLTDKILDFAELGNMAYQPVNEYSNGMKARLALALSLIINPQIVVIDELLSLVDKMFYAKVISEIQKLKDQGVAFIISDPNSVIIETLCERALWLQFGQMQDLGPTQEVVRQFELENSWFNSQNVLEQEKFIAEGQKKQVDFNIDQLYLAFKNEQFRNGLTRKDEGAMREAFFAGYGSDPLLAFKNNKFIPRASRQSRDTEKGKLSIIALIIIILGAGGFWLHHDHQEKARQEALYSQQSSKNSIRVKSSLKKSSKKKSRKEKIAGNSKKKSSLSGELKKSSSNIQTKLVMVEKGDTLNSLASKYGTDVQTLQKINKLGKSNVIQSGEYVKVPLR